MNFTLNKAVYDGLSGWKWTALKHVMGDLLLGDPAGLDPEAPILDADVWEPGVHGWVAVTD